MTSHGFGHATRVAAVLQEISKSFRSIEILIVGETPKWFWQKNLPANCSYQFYNTTTDIGLVQVSPFAHDLKLTLDRLSDFLSFPASRHFSLVEKVKMLNPHLVFCDISPLGIKIANNLEIPSVLLENFTWDWIYQPILNENSKFKEIIFTLKEIYNQTSKHIQCTPFCQNRTSATKVNPIFRPNIGTRKTVLSKLGLSKDDKYNLVTTGGISMLHSFGNVSRSSFLVVPGKYRRILKDNHIIYIPMNSDIYFPDLVKYSNCVIGKAGYGTVSECWGMNIPFLGVFRDSFRESNILRKFCNKCLQFKEVELTDFLNGSWHNTLVKMSSKKNTKTGSNRTNGAQQVSEEIIKFLFQ